MCEQRRTLPAALVRPIPRGDARRGEKHYRQISRRLGVPLIREVFGSFRRDEVSAVAAAERLGLGRTRFCELYASHIRAAARHQEDRWTPCTSGGDHAPDWPPAIEPLLRKLLSTRPPAPYRFADSDVHRRLGVRVDPATVRRWAIANHLAHPLPSPRPPASACRWQCLKIGALWQLDVTPHRWFPDDPKNYPLLDLLDDCSRVCTGATIYHAEDLLAYFDFLSAAFTEHGLPLELYVDCHSLFFPQRPNTLSQLGAALHFYGISLRYARTPQAKVKIERQHQYWQGRLPALFAAEAITTPEAAKALVADLRRHRNAHEIHRKLGRTPDAAAAAARREKRSVLRTGIKVGPDGRVPVGSQRLRAGVDPGARVIHCLHPNGAISILAREPKAGERPALLLQVGNP